jgi:hypothetical protein
MFSNNFYFDGKAALWTMDSIMLCGARTTALVTVVLPSLNLTFRASTAELTKQNGILDELVLQMKLHLPPHYNFLPIVQSILQAYYQMICQ